MKSDYTIFILDGYTDICLSVISGKKDTCFHKLNKWLGDRGLTYQPDNLRTEDDYSVYSI